MIKIEKIVKSIQKELRNAERYIGYASEEKAKDGDSEIVTTYLKLAQNELANAEMLHTVVEHFIEAYRSKQGEPPEVMKQLWAMEHKDYIEYYGEIKHKLEVARK